MSPMHTYLSLVQAVDNLPHAPVPEHYYRLFLPNYEEPHGYMHPDTVQKMPWTKDFSVNHSTPHRSVTVIDSSNGKNTANAINTAFAHIVQICIDRDVFECIGARHSELFTIPSARYDAPIVLERYAAPLFGTTMRGAHLLAYTNSPKGMSVWISRRSDTVLTFPGLLDSTAAGGLKATSTALQTVIEEAAEEASLDEKIMTGVRSRGVISLMNKTGCEFFGQENLLVPGYIYVFDLELPGHVVPAPCDDEVKGFELMSIKHVQDALLAGEFKPDSASVMIHFMILHGILTVDNVPDFVEIQTTLHRRLPFRVGRYS